MCLSVAALMDASIVTSLPSRRMSTSPTCHTSVPANWTAPCWVRCSGFEQHRGCDFLLEIRVFRVIRGQKHDRILPRIARITPMNRRGYKKVVQYRKESMFSTCCTVRNGLRELRTWRCPATRILSATQRSSVTAGLKGVAVVAWRIFAVLQV